MVEKNKEKLTHDINTKSYENIIFTYQFLGQEDTTADEHDRVKNKFDLKRKKKGIKKKQILKKIYLSSNSDKVCAVYKRNSKTIYINLNFSGGTKIYLLS